MSGLEIPDLVGKIIGVRYDSGNESFAYIEVASLELQAGRYFLAGNTIRMPFDNSEGIRFCVAWDVVTAYYEFDSTEECHKVYASWYPPKKKSGFWPIQSR